jgi:serine phosphatase RsbU (regulator of sigma subunit)
LGVFEAQLYDTAIDLSLGDVLVLYTDGLMERPGQGQSGFDRLVRLLQGCRDLGLEEITERIDELTAEGATDDRAWVVLRAVGPGASDIG